MHGGIYNEASSQQEGSYTQAYNNSQVLSLRI